MIHIPDNVKSGMVAVVGIPFDAYSSFMQGTAPAPPRIREIWGAVACNLCSESGIDLGMHAEFIDLGDMDITAESAAMREIEGTADELKKWHPACWNCRRSFRLNHES